VWPLEDHQHLLCLIEILPLRIGPGDMAVQGAVRPLVSRQDERQVRRKGGPVILRDQGRKAVVAHEPVQGREVFFLKQFRHVHSCNSPLYKWSHI
jgi:hypothetical protein